LTIRLIVIVALSVTAAVTAALWFAGSEVTESDARAYQSVHIFTCRKMLIGLSDGSCTEDIHGPGMLTIHLKPDPVRTSWEVAITGLATLAKACEFHGSFQQTRLSALQGHAEASLRCPITSVVDRAHHQLAFQNRLDAPGTSLSIIVEYER